MVTCSLTDVESSGKRGRSFSQAVWHRVIRKNFTLGTQNFFHGYIISLKFTEDDVSKTKKKKTSDVQAQRMSRIFSCVVLMFDVSIGIEYFNLLVVQCVQLPHWRSTGVGTGKVLKTRQNRWNFALQQPLQVGGVWDLARQ